MTATPPSITSAWPVIIFDASEAKNKTPPTISSGSKASFRHWRSIWATSASDGFVEDFEDAGATVLANLTTHTHDDGVQGEGRPHSAALIVTPPTLFAKTHVDMCACVCACVHADPCVQVCARTISTVDVCTCE